MNKEKQNEEIQSRREFFKKAALGALPIIGGIVLASCNRGASSIGDALENASTSLSNAEEKAATKKDPMDCGYTCTGACEGRCSGSCKNNCGGTCSGTCSGSCTSCRGTCSGDCSTSCKSHCSRTCIGSCSGSSSRN